MAELLQVPQESQLLLFVRLCSAFVSFVQFVARMTGAKIAIQFIMTLFAHLLSRIDTNDRMIFNSMDIILQSP